MRDERGGQEQAVGAKVQATGHARLATAVGLIAIGLGVGVALRHLVVQAPELAWACSATPRPWWCGLREGLIIAFRYQGVGLLAATAGALALFGGARAGAATRHCASLALATGAAGLLLYAPELSAAGLLLGSLRVLRS